MAPGLAIVYGLPLHLSVIHFHDLRTLKRCDR